VRSDASRVFAGAIAACCAALAPPAIADKCYVAGDSVHWIADYCMATLSTDDEIAAGDCIATETRAPHGDECATRRHYKEALCALAIERGLRKGSVGACMSDTSFEGSTVRGKGVPGR
jgi:hypothetical protein